MLLTVLFLWENLKEEPKMKSHKLGNQFVFYIRKMTRGFIAEVTGLSIEELENNFRI